MLTPMETEPCPRMNGSVIDSTIRLATTATSCSPEIPSSMAVNSSPPMRAIVSTSLTQFFNRSATDFSN